MNSENNIKKYFRGTLFFLLRKLNGDEVINCSPTRMLCRCNVQEKRLIAISDENQGTR